MRSDFYANRARLDFAAADMLQAQETKIADLNKQEIQNNTESLIEAAAISGGTAIHNKRVRTQNAERAMMYENQFINKAFTAVLTEAVRRSLLLNEEAYAELNPNYVSEISATVKSFLENADINAQIQSKDVQDIYSVIKENIPAADLYLTEENEIGIISQNIMPNEKIDSALDRIAGDAKIRVANLVSADQKALSAQQDVLDKADNKELEAAPVVPVEEPMPQDDVMQDPDAPQEQAPEQIEQPMEAQQPVQESAKLVIVKESKKQGILETLAINEANQMIAEGKDYNQTLALANALKYITILETLDTTGIVSIGSQGYNRILSASGVDLSPVPRVSIPGSGIVDTPIFTQKDEVVGKNSAVKDIADNKEKALCDKISDIVKSSLPDDMIFSAQTKVFEPFHKYEKETAKFGSNLADIPTKKLNEATWIDRKGTVLTESQLKQKLEKEGFDFDYVDFESLARDWNYKKQ